MPTSWLCLMYHDVVRAPLQRGQADYLSVSADAFEAQLDWLQREGYRTSHLGEALATGDASTVAITFDDGDLGQFDNAVPALSARGMTATFFVTTGWIDQPGYISWDQLRLMQQAGMEIGSHTVTHPALSQLDAAAVEREFVDARRELDEQLNQETSALALPGGDFPSRPLRRLLHDAGYGVVATSKWGANPIRSRAANSPAFIKRCTIGSDTDIGTFIGVVRRSPSVWWRRRMAYAAKDALKMAVGRSRYSRWRKAFLDRTVSRTSMPQ